MTELKQRDVLIRHITRNDSHLLLSLMTKLSKFEGYFEDFHISEADIIERGLSNNPQFKALVATNLLNNDLMGMAVYYFVPFTYSLKPDMILKEFYVNEKSRGQGIGEKLFKKLTHIAKQSGCGQIIWLVLNDNLRAQKFYKKLDASADTKWQRWTLSL